MLWKEVCFQHQAGTAKGSGTTEEQKTSAEHPPLGGAGQHHPQQSLLQPLGGTVLLHVPGAEALELAGLEGHVDMRFPAGRRGDVQPEGVFLLGKSTSA